MPTLYFVYQTSDECLSEDDQDFREYRRTFTPVSLTRKRPRLPLAPEHSVENHDVSAEVYNSPRVYAVIARYSDGCTFSRTSGNGCLWKVFSTIEEAEAEKEEIYRSDSAGSPSIYMPWNSYFAGLEGVEIHSFDVTSESGVHHH